MTSPVDPTVLARELLDARDRGAVVPVPPSSRDHGLDLDTAYAVERALARMQIDRGRRLVGYKIGFASKAVWRVLGLQTLVWAHMYDDTVQRAPAAGTEYRVTSAGGALRSAKIEPEIVFAMKQPIEGDTADAAAVLAAVESIALGFEIIDCPYPDWKFQPADFVASFGFHAALFIGPPRRVEAPAIPALVEQLARFKVKLSRDGALVDEGGGRNVLRSPALCLGELAAAMTRRGDAALEAGDLVSSGTLTESQLISPGETWTATLEGLDLPELTLRT